MDDKYRWMTEAEYLLEVDRLEMLVRDFCEGSGLYTYKSVKVDMRTLKDIIVRVHKRKHYFKIFHNEMITSEYKETALYCYWILKLRPLWIDPGGVKVFL